MQRFNLCFTLVSMTMLHTVASPSAVAYCAKVNITQAHRARVPVCPRTCALIDSEVTELPGRRRLRSSSTSPLDSHDFESLLSRTSPAFKFKLKLPVFCLFLICNCKVTAVLFAVFP